MNKSGISIMLTFLLFIVQYSGAQSVDQIINAHLKASGQDQLNKISTVRSYGKAVQMGMELPFLQIQKRPDKMYLEIDIQGMKMIQAYDGEKGWLIEPWVNPDSRELTGQELYNFGQMASIDSDLVDWDKKNYSLEFIGREKFYDSEVFRLKLIKDDGETYLFYIDVDSYLIKKMVTHSDYEGSIVEGETILSDYRDINGIKVPFMTEVRYGGQTLMTNLIEKVEFDVMIEDRFFSIP